MTTANAGLAKKLNFKDGMAVRVIDRPEGVDLGDLRVVDAEEADGLIAFLRRLDEVDATCAPVVDVAKRDGLAWIAYPKAGKLGTDLNRDILWEHMKTHDIEGVRLVSIDATWSAMRFRPKK